MLLPDKHLRLSESVLGFSALVLSQISAPEPFDSVWRRVEKVLGTPKWPAVHGVEDFVLALCFLHSVGAVDVSAGGELFRCG